MEDENDSLETTGLFTLEGPPEETPAFAAFPPEDEAPTPRIRAVPEEETPLFQAEEETPLFQAEEETPLFQAEETPLFQAEETPLFQADPPDPVFSTEPMQTEPTIKLGSARPPPEPIISGLPPTERAAQAAEPVPPTKSKSKWKAIPMLVALSITVNGGIAAAIIHFHHPAEVPAATAAATEEVKRQLDEVKGAQGDTRADLTDARQRLDEQEKKLNATIETVTETAKRQKEAESAAKEAEAHHAKEFATINARLTRDEKEVFSLDEALKMIDVVGGKPVREVREEKSEKPEHKAEPKSEAKEEKPEHKAEHGEGKPEAKPEPKAEPKEEKPEHKPNHGEGKGEPKHHHDDE